MTEAASSKHDANEPMAIRLKCHVGGRFVVDGNTRRYEGGEIRLVTIHFGITYSELMFKLAEEYGAVTLKYELGDGDLVTVRSQEDVMELCHEYRDMRSVKRYLEVYLFEAMEGEVFDDFHDEYVPSASVDSSLGFSEFIDDEDLIDEETEFHMEPIEEAALYEPEFPSPIGGLHCGSESSQKTIHPPLDSLSATFPPSEFCKDVFLMEPDHEHDETGEVFVYKPVGKRPRTDSDPTADSIVYCDGDSVSSITTCLQAGSVHADVPSSPALSHESACASLIGLRAVAEGVAEDVLESVKDTEVGDDGRDAIHVFTAPEAPSPINAVSALVLSRRSSKEERGVESEIPISEIQISHMIGQGGFGHVYKASWRGTEVAVKRLYQSLAPQIQISEFRSEVDLLSKLRHPNVVLFMGYCPPPHLSIITELCWGSLHQVLRSSAVALQWSKVLKLATDIARGMNYLHGFTQPIVHLDLKSQNILVDENMNAKITDFGLSRFKINSYISGQHGMRGTFGWMAPEVIEKKPFTEKADVWSFGVLLWELGARRDPYEGKDAPQIVYEVMARHPLPPLSPSCPADYSKLVEECRSYDPSRRPSFGAILQRLRSLSEQMSSQQLAMCVV